MSYLKKVVSIVLISILIFSTSALAASGQHEVTANKLYFRQKASSDAKVLDVLPEGTVVTVLSTDDGWAKLRWDGMEGYASEEYLKKITAASVQGKNTTKLSGTGWARKDTIMYKAADSASDEVMTAAKGTRLTICGETMSFYYVKADGKYGYIIKSRVSFDEVKGEQTKIEESKEDKKEDTKEEEKKEEEKKEDSSSESSVLRTGSEGSAVKELQQRLCDLGYLKERYITGYYGERTEQAVTSFQVVNSLSADGVAGPATRKKLASGSAKKCPEVVEMDWYDTKVASMVYKRGGTAKIIDCKTGTVINIRRVGGYNHMDVEPLKAEDTRKLKQIYGGEWSWGRRAVILVVDGKYIAASINGMPHGAEISTSNGFDGQFCLHTTNSRTHGTDRVDSAHQKCVEQALKYEFD